MGELPAGFSAKVQVPGLVDLAILKIDTLQAMYKDGWYWYRSNFSLADTDFDKIELKIFKAKYHTKVYLNDRYIGEKHVLLHPILF